MKYRDWFGALHWQQYALSQRQPNHRWGWMELEEEEVKMKDHR